MGHVDMRKLPAAAQEERRRQVIGLRQAGVTYGAIAEQVGLSRTGVFNICQRRWCTNRVMGAERRLSPPFRRCAAIPACRAASSG